MAKIQRVIDYMTKNPSQILFTDSVREAILIMDTDKYRHLPVINGQGTVVGMLSDRDLSSYTAGVASARPEQAEEQEETPVSAIMASPVEEISPDEDMQSAAQRLLDSGHGALVVIDGKQLVGILSYVDILRAFADLELEE